MLWERSHGYIGGFEIWSWTSIETIGRNSLGESLSRDEGSLYLIVEENHLK